MNFKLQFLCIALMLFHFGNFSVSFSLSKNTVESIDKWTDVGVKAAQLGVNDNNADLSTAIAVVDALGSAISYAGPLATLISGIMSIFVPSELSQVLDKLEDMNRKLEHLDDLIGEVLIKIESVTIIAHYKSKVEDINKLKHAYERFTSTPNNLTRDDFRRECGTNKMLEFVHWIEAELNSETQLPLKQVMVQNFEMRTFNYWSNQIVTMLSSALFLHTTCVGVSGYDKSTINETLNGREDGHIGDIQVIQQLLTNVQDGLNKGVQYIREKFFVTAKGEVESFMRDHVKTWDHEGFVDHLYDMLSSKYYWRSWSVTSWKDSTKGWDKHTVMSHSGSGNSWYWHKQYKRCLLVGSVLADYSFGELARQMNHCDFEKWGVHIDGRLAETLNDYFDDCISSSTKLSSLAVVQKGNGLATRGESEFSDNVRFNHKDLTIVAIPFD